MKLEFHFSLFVQPIFSYGANIDIRDTVKYKEVMNWYNLCPNGGILTSLNLFATKFNEIEKLSWSASGPIITETFASTFPTVISYVVDTPRSSSPVAFTSNMLYACSILYKTRLPSVLALNKTDVAQHEFALENLPRDGQRLEVERRQQNVDKLRKDMEKSGGESVVLSTELTSYYTAFKELPTGIFQIAPNLFQFMICSQRLFKSIICMSLANFSSSICYGFLHQFKLP
ncbi:hypothetical protein MKW92_016927 [Papaver armeniacum]|nr:hypothetical protein MKW92_016927 [Papaver armeniacum]